MNTEKKITIIHRYFWPQNYPYATMLKDIVEALVSSGAKVSVCTSFSGDENERINREAWARKHSVDIAVTNLNGERRASVLRKALNAVWFAFWVVFQLVSKRHRVVMVATTPPVIIAFVVSLISKLKKFKVVYHCQDIHPESLRVNGSLKSKWLYKVLFWMDSYVVRNAWKVIVLSKDMEKTLVRRGLSGNNISVINNFIFQALVESPLTKRKESERGKVKFIFAGSLGRFQNLDNLISGIASFRDRKDVEFLFLGDGPLKSRIESFSQVEKLSNVFFCSQVPVEAALEQMYGSDVGIVSISEGISKVAFPSKAIMYMSTGLPVLAIMDLDSELPAILQSNNFGVSVAPNVLEIKKGIDLILEQVKAGAFSRSSIAEYAEEMYSKAFILGKFTNLLMDCKAC